MYRTLRILTALVALSLSGCVALVATGMVTAASVAHDRRSTAEVWKDNRLKLTIVDTLNRDKQIALENNVSVISHNRIVLLVGQVRDQALRERVLGIVRSFDDVRRVIDELEVREPVGVAVRTRDATITARVKTGLLNIVDLPGFDPTRVNVTTEDGTVYLMGLVSAEEGERVAASASSLSGVLQVVKVFEYIEVP